MQVWSLSREDTLEEGMAIPSSLLAWRIPWTRSLHGAWQTAVPGVVKGWTWLKRLSPATIVESVLSKPGCTTDLLPISNFSIALSSLFGFRESRVELSSPIGREEGTSPHSPMFLLLDSSLTIDDSGSVPLFMLKVTSWCDCWWEMAVLSE